MTVHDHLRQFAGAPVAVFEDDPAPDGPVAWALRTEYDGEDWGAIFERFLAATDLASVTHLVIGCWAPDVEEKASVPRDLLVEAAPRLPNLKAIFFGDIIMEEQEISWIEQSDLTPLLDAYPGLERLDVRGGTGLELSPVSSEALRVLRLESGGLPAGVVRSVAASDLPRLETLDLWLGTTNYGGDTAVTDLAGIMRGDRLPALTRLGLMDSEIQDEICSAVATAPVVARLAELDLSMGALTDDGAEALLSGQPLTHLRELNLRHHFLSEPMRSRLRAALPGPPLLIDDPQPDRGWGRYIAVSE